MSSDPPSNRDRDRDASTTATRERVVLLAEHDPITVLETLPRTVFPVSARIELGRTVGDDKPYSDHDRGTLPVEPRRPEPVPYIPETTVYFTNPAERAPADRTAWTPQECADELAHLLDHFEAATNTDPERLRLRGLCLAELPAQYLTMDDGHHVASPMLYEENGPITLTYFRHDLSLAAHDVREELDDALPGRTRSPLQLVRLDELTAKPARHGEGTTGKASRCRYYTEAEAEAANDLSRTPAVWQLERTMTAHGSARPLDTILTQLDDFCPAVADSPLTKDVTFSGETGTQERFYADDILAE
ncbi:hypothetical protein [Halococcus thailandensis]|uniref:Uncharacterized protein n=1 Tax=Halococcus thailandensis JCM 13552 TaxID=1227457 RepID=M0MUS8_9EURY|nr:hypothetical protein [Halococcus thailandensis]EMA48215.1 hypothetical protein C451_20677 [Halococcus thailandensis JCM 13552]